MEGEEGEASSEDDGDEVEERGERMRNRIDWTIRKMERLEGNTKEERAKTIKGYIC